MLMGISLCGHTYGFMLYFPFRYIIHAQYAFPMGLVLFEEFTLFT